MTGLKKRFPAWAGSPRLAAAWLALLLCAAALRVVAAWNDFWLDEIWSVALAREVSSPLDVFTLHHENNHYLNTLWLLVLHGANYPLLCRLPSLLAAICSVAVAGAIGWRRNSAAGFCCAVLVAFSYVFTLVSTEARGYSSAILCALFCYWMLEIYFAGPSRRVAAAYAASAILGLASHPFFVSFYLAAMVWTLYRGTHRGQSARERMVPFIELHGIPLAVLAVFYVIDLHDLEIGGGTDADSITGRYCDAATWMLAVPWAGRAVPSALALGVLALGVWQLRREASRSFVFFPAVIVFPLVFSLLRGSTVVYVRHFAIAITFWLLLAGFVAAELYQRGGWARRASVVSILCYLAANSWYLVELSQFGRGQYSKALEFIAQHTTSPVVRVAGDHDTRVGQTLIFHVTENAHGKRWHYSGTERWPKEGVEWAILHKESFDDPSPPFPEATDDWGNQYAFVRGFPSAPLSGLHWFLYHRR
ncbi:MAG TPA: hypothetical protein VG826_24985 [Pirellulales bacterium]|nr:hypothetical protein [Pirellulales bacterium]